MTKSEMRQEIKRLKKEVDYLNLRLKQHGCSNCGKPLNLDYDCINPDCPISYMRTTATIGEPTDIKTSDSRERCAKLRGEK